jgi:hypothetical protein
MIRCDPNVSLAAKKPNESPVKKLLPFSALGRRSLMMGAVLLPAPSQADAAVPQPLASNLVVASRRLWNGRDCLSVELAEDEQEGRLRKTRSANAPSFAVVHRDFADGVIEVDIGAELTGRGAPDARGFAGLSFHIDRDLQTHESVYLRMINGRLNRPTPAPPRIDRAIQYVAHPDFHFAISREKYPGRYEKGADIALGRWHRFRLEIEGPRLRALVDGAEALAVDDLHYAGRRGAIGLFVDDGSRGFFTNFGILVA